jgi:hypothetical protein
LIGACADKLHLHAAPARRACTPRLHAAPACSPLILHNFYHRLHIKTELF